MPGLTDEEDLLRIDMERSQDENPDLLAAMAQAQDGDRLELDLIESGHYGRSNDPAADQVMALRALGDLLSLVRQKAVDDRWPQDQNTLLNFAFKNGHHYIEVDRARRGVVPIPAPKGYVRRTIDKFGPWYRGQHGKLSAGMPQTQVVAKSNTFENKDSSEYAEELLEWLHPQAWSHEHRSQLAMWQLLGGVGVMYCGVEWTEDEMYLEETGGSGVGMMHRPDLVFQIHSPMECWTDNRHATIREMPWFGRDLFMRVSDARAAFLSAEDQRRIVPVGSDVTERGYHTLREAQRMMGMADPWGHSGASSSPNLTDEEDEAVVAEFWGRRGLTLQGQWLMGLVGVPELDVEVLDTGEDGQLPLVRFPNGLRVAFTPEGWILEIANNHHGRLPFREVKVSQSAGFWTPAWATPLREVNQAIDWIVSLREQHLQRTGNPTLLEPSDAQVHRRSGIMGTISRIIYRANRYNARPEWMNPPQMPSDTIQFLGEMERIWQDVSGVHEVSEGRLPTRLSGVAVALLQEQDVSQLGFAGQEIESAYADIMKQALVNIQKFFPDGDPRLVRLAGDAPFRLTSFMFSDLEDDLGIQVRPGSAIPRSPAVVRAEARELWEIGALVDDMGRPDFRKLNEAYGMGSRDELYFEDDVDKANARGEEELILSLPEEVALLVLMTGMNEGQFPPPFNVKAFDNDLVHERSHRLRLKKIVNDDRIPDVNKQLLEFHWMGHLEAAMPILIQTNPEVVAPMLGGMGGGEEEGPTEED